MRSWEFGFIHTKFIRAVENGIACYTDVEMQIPQFIWGQIDKSLEEQRGSIIVRMTLSSLSKKNNFKTRKT
jgi:hypothetical protein